MSGIFDENGKVIDREALRSVGIVGAPHTPRTHYDRDRGVEHVEVLHEDTGRHAGFLTKHDSGRVDATVRPEPASIKSTAVEPRSVD